MDSGAPESYNDAMTMSFTKMHGLGNDFVVLDARRNPVTLTTAQVQAIADRRTGVGCDQFVLVEAPRTAGTAAFMRIFNGDGGEVGACGNATRCVAWMLMAESGHGHVLIETRAGLLDARDAGPRMVTVDMGPARLDWTEIPLAEAVDTLHLPIDLGTLNDPVAVGMGNPHVVFFVPAVDDIPLDYLGPALEVHPLFPERANIEVAEIQGPERIRMRVWERGAGITRACGTGACATLVAAARRGLTGRRAEVVLDGGSLTIAWREADGHVLMTGPVAVSFTGTLSAGVLGGGGPE